MIMESQCMERENHIRVCEEEKKRDVLCLLPILLIVFLKIIWND